MAIVSRRLFSLAFVLTPLVSLLYLLDRADPTNLLILQCAIAFGAAHVIWLLLRMPLAGTGSALPLLSSVIQIAQITVICAIGYIILMPDAGLDAGRALTLSVKVMTSGPQPLIASEGILTTLMTAQSAMSWVYLAIITAAALAGLMPRSQRPSRAKLGLFRQSSAHLRVLPRKPLNITDVMRPRTGRDTDFDVGFGRINRDEPITARHGCQEN